MKFIYEHLLRNPIKRNLGNGNLNNKIKQIEKKLGFTYYTFDINKCEDVCEYLKKLNNYILTGLHINIVFDTQFILLVNAKYELLRALLLILGKWMNNLQDIKSLQELM